jgi:hypothetical protein
MGNNRTEKAVLLLEEILVALFKLQKVVIKQFPQ